MSSGLSALGAGLSAWGSLMGARQAQEKKDAEDAKKVADAAKALKEKREYDATVRAEENAAKIERDQAQAKAAVKLQAKKAQDAMDATNARISAQSKSNYGLEDLRHTNRLSEASQQEALLGARPPTTYKPPGPVRAEDGSLLERDPETGAYKPIKVEGQTSLKDTLGAFAQALPGLLGGGSGGVAQAPSRNVRAAPSAAPQAVAGGGTQASPATPKSQEEFDALPVGTWVRLPSGQIKQKIK